MDTPRTDGGKSDPSPKKTPREKKVEKGKRRAVVAETLSDDNFYCKKGLECPGRAPPEGNGTCFKLHTTPVEAARLKDLHKKRLEKDGKRSGRKKGSPGPTPSGSPR